jgi:peptide/nickel transport system substrate-binding protein
MRSGSPVEKENTVHRDPSPDKDEAVMAAPDAIDPSILENRAFHQAPMLDRQVHSGRLLPVEDRLPVNPVVIVPIREIGEYGGTLRRSLAADIVEASRVKKTLSESLMSFERPFPRSVQPNLAESFEFQEGGRKIVITLREGIRWSDGEPFTVDDILFWYQDMTVNDNARHAPVFPTRWLNGGKPVRMEKSDDLTLIISSDYPLGQILHTLCHDDIALPKHVFSAFHPKYNPESSYELLLEKTSPGQLTFQPGTPSLSAWVPSTWKNGQSAAFERNPFYWKIDTAGNQLPYADNLEFSIVPNDALTLLKFQNGDTDLLSHGVAESAFGALKQSERARGYTLHLTAPTPNLALYLNWDSPNQSLREAFREKRVRIALSLALNREEISEIVFSGLLVPASYSFSLISPYYTKTHAQRYAEFAPGRANEFLDACGYLDSDGDGYREFPDGSIFQLTIDVASLPHSIDLSQLIAEQWKAIGIQVHLNIALQEIITPRRIQGEFDITIKDVATCPLTQSHILSVAGPHLPFWHRNADTEGPDWLVSVTSSIEKAKIEMDPDNLAEHMIEIRNQITENIPFITLGTYRNVWGSNNRLGNVPDVTHVEDLYRGWDRAVFHEQLFIRQRQP